MRRRLDSEAFKYQVLQRRQPANQLENATLGLEGQEDVGRVATNAEGGDEVCDVAVLFKELGVGREDASTRTRRRVVDIDIEALKKATSSRLCPLPMQPRARAEEVLVVCMTVQNHDNDFDVEGT